MKNVRSSAPRLPALYAAVLGLVLLAGDNTAQATGPGAPEAGFDMVSTGANTGTTLGFINPCVSVPNIPGTTFTIDSFLDAVPSGEDLRLWNYGLGFPDNVVKLITADYSASMTPTPPYVDASEGAGAPGPGAGDDTISPQSVSVSHPGAGPYTPSGTLGVLGRYTFEVLAGATSGTYYFYFSPATASFQDGALNDWTSSVSFATYGIGMLAVGTGCPGTTDVLVDSVTSASPAGAAVGTVQHHR